MRLRPAVQVGMHPTTCRGRARAIAGRERSPSPVARGWVTERRIRIPPLENARARCARAMKVEYTFRPNLRNRCVADDGRVFENMLTVLLNTEWPGQLPIKTNRFNQRQCRSIWQWLGRTDPAPKFMDCYVFGEDVHRIFPKKRGDDV